MLKPVLGSQIQLGHPLARGLVGCWLMNEGGGNIVNDLSGNGNAGTFVGDTHFVAGKFGSALSFDGDRDDVDCGKNLPAEMHTGTVAAWVRGYRHQGGIASNGRYSSGTNGFTLATKDEAVILKIGDAASSISVIGMGRLSYPDVWNFVVAVWDGEYMNIYVNGVIDTIPVAQTLDPRMNYYVFRIGSNGYGSSSVYSWNDLIDNVSLYNRALSAQEIAQLYINPFGMFEEEM